MTMKRLVVKTQILILLACTQAMAALDDAPISHEPPPPVTQTNDLVNAPDLMRAYLEVQSQLQATQLALEQTQSETAATTARTAKALSDRLDELEQAHTRDWQTAQSNSHLILIVAGVCAAFGFLAMLCMAYFQWRGINRLTELFAATGGRRRLEPGQALPALSAGEFAMEPPSESTLRLLDVVERLEKRVVQLEHTTQPLIQDSTAPVEVSTGSTATPPVPPALSADQIARITLLLGKGQSLLNLDKSEEAIACFDEILAMDQNNTDTLMKKGVALERQRKLTEAVECYDRAIAVDRSMTIAYLYKGGVFNRLERFDEALACYEQALHTQENGNGTNGN